VLVAVFSLDDGSLLQEDEHTFATTALAGCLSPTNDELYLFEHARGTSVIHKYAVTPPAPKAKWRAQRIKDDKDESDALTAGVPTARMLEEQYPLPPLPDPKALAAAAAAADLDDEFEPDVDAVDSATAIVVRCVCVCGLDHLFGAAHTRPFGLGLVCSKF
jgi:hypothetical protein